MAVVATAMAMALAACGGGGATSGSGAQGATGNPVEGGNATVLMLSEPRTLDPAFGSNNGPGGAVVGNALFGTLLRTDPATGAITPSLAASFKTADGGKTFELALRPGLRFSDGSPFEASAVKAHWDRLKDPATGSLYQGDAAQVASTEATSATTLRVTMTAAVPNFGYSVVTSSLNWVPKPEAIAAGGASFDAKPIGAGPYVLQEWRRQDALVLKRNPSYWDAPRPHLDQLTLRPAIDGNQRLNTMVSGGADVAVESSWSNLQKAGQSNLVTAVQPLSGGNYIALNTRRAPFNDLRARQALAAAIDPQALNVSVFGGAGQLVDTLFDASSPFHTGTPVGAPDKATAQRLFNELAAEGKTVSFTFTATSSSENRALAEAIQAQLNAFQNVKMQVKVVEYAELAKLQTTHDFDATVSSAAFLDPEPRLWTAFAADSRSNMSGINDPELNAALVKGRTSTSADERKAAYDQVQKRLVEDHPNLWLTRNVSAAISSKQIGGVEQYGFGSLLPDALWKQH
ncbi:peptide ABC transporter substrate-binding protein [Amycolatopsis sp. NBRC 101858]|uniref:ABC transporter substrate-binding protein n=1 Tax=Amycolatopsis sp. NBRC 101858 TaxID=3032200 RepID=UPI0024A47E4B|nr:ABC transporter substrate-binding protein [Amycolatopsis sp. NBRC 101858]GLY38950.1 peptide ABC transporter substrate-binding protein [Amycolatopsis sp. NBRC 101858]